MSLCLASPKSEQNSTLPDCEFLHLFIQEDLIGTYYMLLTMKDIHWYNDKQENLSPISDELNI